jgi:hypothetical protein
MTRPADYRLILPEGWFRIDLEPGSREKSIATLVQRQFRGADDAPHLKQEARQKLLATAHDAFRNGGIELHVSMQTAAGFPLSAALVVTLTPPHEHDQVMITPARLAETLTRDGRQVTIMDLPAGQAVRVRNGEPPVTNLDIHIPVPGSSAYLLLSFSTPLAPLADALVGMFDAIAGTLRWIP